MFRIVTTVVLLVCAILGVALVDATDRKRCDSLEPAVKESFSELADLLDTTGLLPALADFRGTIFAPTNDAIKEAQSVVMDKVETEELSEEEAIEALKNVVLYHLVPDAAVFSGSVATGRLQLNTGLGEPQKLDEFCKLLGLEPPKTDKLVLSQALRVVTPSVVAKVVPDLADLEFCGPIVVHAIDKLLVPCEL